MRSAAMNVIHNAVCALVLLVPLGEPTWANAADCPSSGAAAVAAYYSAIKSVDVLTLAALTRSSDWIRKEQIQEMSSRLASFKIVSSKALVNKSNSRKLLIRVQQQWKDPISQSIAFFEVAPSMGCWVIVDFGTEE